MLLKSLMFSSLAILVLAITITAQTADSPKLPDTLVGQRVAAFIKAFNSSNEQVMRAFFAENVAPTALEQRPIEARLEVYREMHGNLGAIELRWVVAASDSAVKILVHGKTGEWREFAFQFAQEPPQKLIGMGVNDAQAPTDGPAESKSAARMTEAEVVTAIDGYLNTLVAGDEFSGTVLLANGSKPLFQKAYGLASKEFNVPNRLDTKFNLGSINKIFTQVAIGQLVEQGKLSLDDKLNKYLPDYPNHEAAEKIRIRQLLNMTSGIGDFFGPEFDATPKDKIRRIKDYLQFFASKPLEFEPGTKRQYSNGGYIVLGDLIEKISGQDYYDYVRENIFKPAGMLNTDWFEGDTPIPNLAVGYTREGMEKGGKNTRRSNIYIRPARGSSAGGGYSTAEDLLKFSLALQSQKLRILDFGQDEGSATIKPAGIRPLGAAGGAPGTNALLEVMGASGYTIIVLSNYDPPSAVNVGKEIQEWLDRVKK